MSSILCITPTDACCDFCVQIKRTSGQWYWAEYSTFSISDEVGKYQLTVDGYSGDADNALMTTQLTDWISNGMRFSAQDRDNDIHNVHCAGTGSGGWKGGWWYRRCSTSVINRDANGIWTTVSPAMDVLASRMLVKLN